jgi:tetratricopeptide (TPR) repeat protein
MKKSLILILAALFAATSTVFAGYSSHKEAMKAGDQKLFKENDFAAAQAIYEEAADLAEKAWEFGSADQRIGLCLIKQGQVDEGIARLVEVSKGDYRDYVKIDAYAALGDVYYFRLKDNGKAAAYYKKALGFEMKEDRRKGIEKKLAKAEG